MLVDPSIETLSFAGLDDCSSGSSKQPQRPGSDRLGARVDMAALLYSMPPGILLITEHVGKLHKDCQQQDCLNYNLCCADGGLHAAAAA